MTGQPRKRMLSASLAPDSSHDAQPMTGNGNACHFHPSVAAPMGEETCEEVTRDEDLLAAVARTQYAARRLRDTLFQMEIFAEPSWDMLLDLYIQRHRKRPVSTHSLCIAAAVPQTTALRWIAKLKSNGLINRHPCPHDNRVIHVSLSDKAVDLIERYLASQIDNRDAFANDLSTRN